jgi:hypothetical protein
MQFSVAVRNARQEAIETTVGTAPTLEIRSGPKPANCAAADSGTLLASIVLPSDWSADASAGAKTLLGSWLDPSANATGTAEHYRIKQGGTCHVQGTASMAGGGGELILNNTNIAAGQPVSVTAFTTTDGNA